MPGPVTINVPLLSRDPGLGRGAAACRPPSTTVATTQIHKASLQRPSITAADTLRYSGQCRPYSPVPHHTHPQTVQAAAPAPSPAPAGALDPKEFKSFKLTAKTQLTPNTYNFRYALRGLRVRPSFKREGGAFLASHL